MSNARPIIIVHTRDTSKPDEWPFWSLPNESLVALFHARGCIHGRMVDAENITKACADHGIGPEDIDVCVACGHEPDHVFRAMQAMIDCSLSRPIYVTFHEGIDGKKNTKLPAELWLKLPNESRIVVYSIGEDEMHRQIIHRYSEAARYGLPEYAADLAQLTQFLLAEFLNPDMPDSQTESTS